MSKNENAILETYINNAEKTMVYNICDNIYNK